MKDCNFLSKILPYPTEGDGDGDSDGLIDLDSLLSTGVGSDHKKPDNFKPDNEGGDDEGNKGDINQSKDDNKKDEGDINNLSLLQGLNSDGLSTEESDLKKELLEKFNGVSIDSNGNILDKDGNVVADFDKVDKFINAEPTFDDKGNQVDEKGKVIKTKSQVEFEKSTIGGVIAELPYKLVDENDNPIIYDDTIEGYTKLAKDIAAVELEEYKQSFFEGNPLLREVSKHILSGGKLEDFNKPIDYTKIDIKKLSDLDKVDLINKSFLASGIDKERANDLVELIKKGGEVDKEANKAIGILDTNQKLQQKQRDIQYQQAIEDENNQVVKYWTGVKQVIDSGKLGKLEIPKEEQQAFFKYLSTPVDDNGNSQETIDNEKQGLDSDLMMRYYRYKGFNVDSIVKSELNKNRVQTLRDKITKAHKSNSSSGSNTSNRSKTMNPGDVSLDELLNM